MAKYIKKPIVVEAITFEEFVEFGKKNATSMVNGTPWAFKFKGIPVTHHKDDCYLISISPSGLDEFTSNDILVIDNNGVGLMKKDFFHTLYDEVVDKEIHSEPKDCSPSFVWI